MPLVRPRSFDAAPPARSTSLAAALLSAVLALVLVLAAVGCGGGGSSDGDGAQARLAGELHYLQARQGLSAAQVDCVAGEVVKERKGDQLAEFEKSVALLRAESDEPVDQAAVDLLAQAVTICVRKVK